MTILNLASEGLHPEMIVLTKALIEAGSMEKSELIAICSAENPARIQGALSKWTSLGLFSEHDGVVSLSNSWKRKRGSNVAESIEQLPSICTKLLFDRANCLPLFGDAAGTSADFVRGTAWLLAQDIYTFPTTWAGGVEPLERRQIVGDNRIIQNDFRWGGLRFWSRYLGFCTGESDRFFIDPTKVVRRSLRAAITSAKAIPADVFVSSLATDYPVFDGGTYRLEVEANLKPSEVRMPAPGHLSCSLSFALIRLRSAGEVLLERRSDSDQTYTLTGQDRASLEVFSHISLARKPT